MELEVIRVIEPRPLSPKDQDRKLWRGLLGILPGTQGHNLWRRSLPRSLWQILGVLPTRPQCLYPQSSPHPRCLQSIAPPSDEPMDEDKPTKPHLQTLLTVGPEASVPICEFDRGVCTSKYRETQVRLPRTCSVPSHCSAVRVSILAKEIKKEFKKKFIFFFTESFPISTFQKSVLLSTQVNFSREAATCICHRKGVPADTLTTFSSRSAVICQNSPRLINMDNATSHILC